MNGPSKSTLPAETSTWRRPDQCSPHIPFHPPPHVNSRLASKIPETAIDESGKLASALVTVSRHAYARARERFHWTRAATDRMARRAACRGLTAQSFPGRGFRSTFEMLYPSSLECLPAIAGGVVFVFGIRSSPQGLTLITVFQTPHLLQHHLSRQRRLLQRTVGFTCNSKTNLDHA